MSGYESEMERTENTVDTLVKLKITIVSKNKITKNSMINIKLPIEEILLSE